jgi:anti-sigma regulatory factor (Ser/Thr protein kinase)
MEISGDLTQLSPIRAFVRAFCSRKICREMPEDDINRLELAVNEAVTNIIKHGYGGNSDRAIRIVALAFEREVSIVLYDHGVQFYPESYALPKLDGSQSGGMGLFIIQSCVDQAKYSRSKDGINCVTLTRRLPSQENCNAPGN